MNRDELDDAEIDEPEESPEHVEVVEGYELPPLFVREGVDAETTTRPILWCYVFKKDPHTKTLGFLDWLPVADLADLDQLRDAYGAGVYMIQGRGANRKDVVKAVTITVHGATSSSAMAFQPSSRAELDFSKLATGIVSIATPILAMVQQWSERNDARRREERQEDERRRTEERTREDSRNQSFMQTMTQLMGARMTDLEALLKAQNAVGGAGSPNGKRVAEAYQDGQADTLELIRAIKSEGLGGEDLESRMVGLVESFMVGNRKGKQDAEGQPDDANGHANGVS